MGNSGERGPAEEPYLKRAPLVHRATEPNSPYQTWYIWDESPVAGFTNGTPWRELNNDIATVNVQAEEADPGSLFNHNRRLIHLRMDYPALRVGDLWLVDSSSDQIYAFLRSYENGAMLVLVNLGKEPVSNYSLSLDKGPLEAVNSVELLLGEGQASVPVVNASGGFEPYQPLPELAPYECVLIWLAP